MLRAVGQYPLSALYNTVTVAAGSAVSLTTVTTANVTSKSLTAGTYLIWGQVDFTMTGATSTVLQAGLSVTSATLPTQAGGSGVGTDPLAIFESFATTLTGTQCIDCGPTLLTIASTTTLFLVTQATFSAGTIAAYGTLNALQLNIA
jgi:hypothetical protein